jgi:hypothetical protein
MYSLDTPEGMRQEKIILTPKENIAKKRNKQAKKDVRKSGKNPIKSPTRTWTIIHQVQLSMQISNCHQMMG